MLITDKNKLDIFYESQRLWQGIPGIERTKGGRLFAAFYSGGIKEDLGNYCALLKSDDDGNTWTEPIAVAYVDENSRCYDPCLWIDTLGRLWFIWSVMPNYAVWASICDEPDANQLNWSEPFDIGYDVMMNKPVVLSTGEWLFPIAVWNKDVSALPGYSSGHEERLAYAYKTTDNGKTFKKTGGVDMAERSFDEHMFLELNDGVLLMLVRTKYGIGKSYSYDGGLTWTKGTDSKIAGPCSRFHIKRLASGNVLLINHYNFKGRNNLTAMISRDDCQTWEGFLMLDERDDVSYPDAVEADNGYIYITYDHERGSYQKSMTELYQKQREILMAKVTEEDILAGKIVSKNSRLKCVISKLGEYKGAVKNPYNEYDKYSIDDYSKMLAELEDGKAISNKIFADYGCCCMNITKEDSVIIDKNMDIIVNNKLNDDMLKKTCTIKKIVEKLQKIQNKDSKETEDFYVNRMFEYINDNITDDLSLDNMAIDLRISKFYMCHLFKKKTYITIIQYKNNRRIAMAKKLLLNSNLTVQDVCMETGFSDASYFTKWFRQIEEMTPKEFRELHKESSNKRR